jgi:hypothetical protein
VTDHTDPNRHLPPHPRSPHCTDRCQNITSLFDHDQPVEVVEVRGEYL